MSRLAWVLAAILLWTAAAVLARASWPVNVLYATALAVSYLAVWALAGAWGDNRQMTFRAVAVTIALLFGVGILEAGAATRKIDYRRIRDALIGIEGPNVDFVEDRDLGFRRAPHTKWTGWPRTDMSTYFNLPFRSEHPITFTTDARGFRNPIDISRADIVLLGDSYIEGYGVSDEETVRARLSARLGRAAVYVGTAGYGTLQEVKALERDGFTVDPRHVVLFFFEGNDLDDDQEYENAMTANGGAANSSPAPPQPWSHRWRDFVDRSFTWNALQQIRQLTDRLVPNRIATFGSFRDAGGHLHQIYFYDFYATRPLTDYERARLKTTDAALRRAAEECARHGADFTVYFVPIKFRVYRDSVTFPPGSPCERWSPWDLESEVRAICERGGIHFVSLTGPMRQAAHRGELLYQPADSHWNAAGAAFVADVVAAHVR